MVQGPEARTYQHGGRRHGCDEDVWRKSLVFPRDCAEFEGRNERSSHRSPQTGKNQQREAAGNHAHSDYLGRRAAVQFFKYAPK